MITHSNHGNHMTSQASRTLRGNLVLFFHSFSKNNTPPLFPLYSFSLEKVTGEINERCLRWSVSRPGRLSELVHTYTHTHTLALSQTRREVRKYEARCTGGMWVRSHRHNICLLGHVFLHEREEVCDDICLTVNHT